MFKIRWQINWLWFQEDISTQLEVIAENMIFFLKSEFRGVLISMSLLYLFALKYNTNLKKFASGARIWSDLQKFEGGYMFIGGVYLHGIKLIALCGLSQ